MPEPLTALDFLMREAVGLPRPPGPLPLAFLHMDLDEHVPMRTRAEAAERLVLVGRHRGAGAVRGLPVGRAGGLGRRLGPGAGGAGARRRAGRRTRASGRRWSPPTRRSAARGLRVALAEAYGAPAGGARPGERSMPTPRRVLAELLLLAGEDAAAARAAGPAPDATAGRAAGDRRGGRGAGWPGRRTGPRRRSPGSRATAAGRRARGRARCDARRGPAGRGDPRGAGAACGPAPAVDPPALRAALLTLRLAGQEEAARAIALETLLAGPVG